ncbi:MAG: nicotinate-nucleotide diphosphorylase (carboxylating), partial [Planctomycetota bacterium]
KYAVRCGGAWNHRTGLFDAVLIKDNHLAGLSASDVGVVLRRWLDRVTALPRPPAFVEVEVDTLEQLRAVLRVDRVDIVLLDNYSVEQLQSAVRLRDEVCASKRPLLEASGGVTLETIATIAATGVDRISVGALTHSAACLDLSLEVA